MTSGRSNLDTATRLHVVQAGSVGLRLFSVGLGLCWGVVFVMLAMRYELHLYGDGSLFAYAIAVQDAWAFHWHNISGRAFVYLFAHAPAEAYLSVTGSVHGAIALYGLLFHAAPIVSLAATFALDRSPKRTIFTFACVSTALVLPLVFGFPTEMWVAHSVIWPTLAYTHYADRGRRSLMLAASLFTALVLTHGGGVLFALTVLSTLALRGPNDGRFRQAVAAFALAMAVWSFAQLSFKPDAYICDALSGAAFNFINLYNFDVPATRAIAVALASYAALYLASRRLALAGSHLVAAVPVAIGLMAYWMCFDTGQLAEMRYPLRTVILVLTPVMGALAAAYTLYEARELAVDVPLLERTLVALKRTLHPHVLIGALMLVTLVHTVETAKFTAGWSSYKVALRNLAMSTASDPQLGNPRFASAQRIGDERNQFAWGSTTHFLSVLLAPDFKPNRLVVDPDTNYFWLSCQTATANMVARRFVPAESRQLVRTHACLHR